MYIVLLIDKDSFEEKVKLWIRALKEFLSEADHNKYPDIKQKYHFEKLIFM